MKVSKSSKLILHSDPKTRHASDSVYIFIWFIMHKNALLTMTFIMLRFAYPVGPDISRKIVWSGDLPGAEPWCFRFCAHFYMIHNAWKCTPYFDLHNVVFRLSRWPWYFSENCMKWRSSRCRTLVNFFVKQFHQLKFWNFGK